MFDYFDSGVMEGLQHRLMHTATVANGPGGSIVFTGKSIALRKSILSGFTEQLIQWYPTDM